MARVVPAELENEVLLTIDFIVPCEDKSGCTAAQRSFVIAAETISLMSLR